jgi:hypothetical protein
MKLFSAADVLHLSREIEGRPGLFVSVALVLKLIYFAEERLGKEAMPRDKKEL